MSTASSRGFRPQHLGDGFACTDTSRDGGHERREDGDGKSQCDNHA
jgi:hypothetical protein